MNSVYAFKRYAPDRRRETGWALLTCAIYLRVGFVGASMVAIGLLSLIGGDGKPLTALVVALTGGALAALGWHCARRALDRIDPPTVDAAGAAAAVDPNVRHRHHDGDFATN